MILEIFYSTSKRPIYTSTSSKNKKAYDDKFWNIWLEFNIYFDGSWRESSPLRRQEHAQKSNCNQCGSRILSIMRRIPRSCLCCRPHHNRLPQCQSQKDQPGRHSKSRHKILRKGDIQQKKWRRISQRKEVCLVHEKTGKHRWKSMILTLTNGRWKTANEIQAGNPWSEWIDNDGLKSNPSILFKIYHL